MVGAVSNPRPAVCVEWSLLGLGLPVVVASGMARAGSSGSVLAIKRTTDRGEG